MAEANISQWARYQSSVQRVIDYIHDHPTGPVDNDTLASVACLSTYHWHRIYRGITGETAIQTVRSVRMHKAASQLIRTDVAIADVGRSVGYQTVQSFTRVFKAHHGISPAEFRNRNREAATKNTTTTAFADEYPVEIINLQGLKIIGLEHKGDYSTVGRSMMKVFAAKVIRDESSADTFGVGVYFQDPSSVENLSELTSFVGVSVSQNTAVPTGFNKYEIPAGRCAVVTYRGPYASLELPYLWLFQRWLPQSGLVIDNKPPFEFYLSDPRNTPSEQLLSKIFIPVI